MHPQIENNRDAIAQACRLHGVRKLEVFGSILRNDFDPKSSDVDVPVEFEAQAADSSTNFLDLKESLETLFGRSVDLMELHAI
jgi:predicted nucleotidyltransferase